MKEVTITIPENCELIKDGNTYIVKEKKQGPPRSWEEFCERYPVKAGESYLMASDRIFTAETNYNSKRLSRVWCTSEEEAEAFLALMQLRQLRKAWVGDWEQPKSATEIAVIEYNNDEKELVTTYGNFWTSITLSFPTLKMAKEFLECFRDLCEIAKSLL